MLRFWNLFFDNGKKKIVHASCQDIPEGVLGRAHDLPPVKFRVFLDGDDHKMKSLLYQAALKKRPHGLQNFMSKNIFDNFVLILKIIIKSRAHQSHFVGDFLNADPV